MLVRSLVAAILMCVTATHAGAATSLACNGYSVALNDHVEHTGRIVGDTAFFDDERCHVITTKKLSSSSAPIRRYELIE
jgi:hypothetical protein